MEDLIQKARERCAELAKIIEAAQAINPEYQELKVFLEMADTVGKRLSPVTDQGAPHSIYRRLSCDG